MELSDALDFARSSGQSVVVTLKADGRPQLSNVVHHVDDDGLIRISITDDRAKTKNLRRDPRVSLYLTSDDFWKYVVIEGTAELSAVAQAPDDAVADAAASTTTAPSGANTPTGTSTARPRSTSSGSCSASTRSGPTAWVSPDRHHERWSTPAP